MGMNGTDILLQVNTGTDLSPMYVTVGSQRDVTFEEKSDDIDVSSKDGQAQRVLPGRYSSSVSLDALYVPDDVAYQALKTAMRPPSTLIKVLRQELGGALEIADAHITGLGDKGPDQGEATTTISFTIDGEWVEVGT